MAVEAPLRRRLSGHRTWTAVVAVNGSIMSLYLWHLTVMVLVLGGSIALGGIGLHAPVNTPTWWVSRPVWLVVLLVLTLPVLAAVAGFERPRRDCRPAPYTWQPIVAVMAVCAGLGLLAKDGMVDAEGLNGLAVFLPFAGLMVGGVVRRPFSHRPA